MKRHSVWLAVAIIITGVFGTIQLTTQQLLRMNANDPQIQLAEDAARQLDKGVAPIQLVSASTVEVEHSLAPFIVVYDAAGQPLASSGLLNGQSLAIPKGVLLASRGQDYHAITWQPNSTVRLSSVTVASKNYYVVAARSLSEVESRVTTLTLITLVGWLLSLFVLALAYYLNRIR